MNQPSYPSASHSMTKIINLRSFDCYPPEKSSTEHLIRSHNEYYYKVVQNNEEKKHILSYNILPLRFKHLYPPPMLSTKMCLKSDKISEKVKKLYPPFFNYVKGKTIPPEGFWNQQITHIKHFTIGGYLSDP